MGDWLSDIEGDEGDYLYLCDMYGEDPTYSPCRSGVTYNRQFPDCYGPHSQKLKERFRAEHGIDVSLRDTLEADKVDR